MTQGIEYMVKNRIYGHGKGWCFTPKHFLDFGNGVSIRKALSSLQKQKTIRRLAKGIYDYPQVHPDLGLIPPDVNSVAQAIAEKNGLKIQPSGAYAANLIGISEQVPGKVVFLSDGRLRKIKIGRTEILFKKASAKTLFAAGTREALVIQAFKFMKQENIDKIAQARTKKFLQGANSKVIARNMKYAPEWIRTLVFEIINGGK